MTISRFILKTHHPDLVNIGDDGWRWDTGANYPNCSRDNPDACQPIQFKTESDAFYYSQTHDETPIRVKSEEQAWSLIEKGKADSVMDAKSTAGAIGFVIAVGVLWFIARRTDG